MATGYFAAETSGMDMRTKAELLSACKNNLHDNLDERGFHMSL